MARSAHSHVRSSLVTNGTYRSGWFGLRAPSLLRVNAPMQNSLPSGSLIVTPPPLRGSLICVPPRAVISTIASSTSSTIRSRCMRILAVFISGTFCSTSQPPPGSSPTVSQPPPLRTGPGSCPSIAAQNAPSISRSLTSRATWTFLIKPANRLQPLLVEPL